MSLLYSQSKTQTRKKNYFRSFLATLGVLIIVIAILKSTWKTIIVAPLNFPTGTIVTINKGDSVRQVSKVFERDNIIKSNSIFQFFIVAIGGDKGIVAGDYSFDKPEPVYAIARRVVQGDLRLEANKITLPEGITIKEMAGIFSKQIPNFDRQDFISNSTNKEGYLFPDTYFFYPTAKTDNVLELLQNNFDAKIKPFLPEIARSGHSLNDIVTMASIIEGESAKGQERPIVAGILWKRISKNMPLQVDATFKYILNKKSSDLTLTDLKIDSPYNTYIHRGLPPGPISNPGISAIQAALNPVASPYYYYLHDDKGQIHYATNFEEHKANKKKYLQ